jgi:hypothetical protein
MGGADQRQLAEKINHYLYFLGEIDRKRELIAVGRLHLTG